MAVSGEQPVQRRVVTFASVSPGAGKTTVPAGSVRTDWHAELLVVRR